MVKVKKCLEAHHIFQLCLGNIGGNPFYKVNLLLLCTADYNICVSDVYC